jgi:hypothetical protein
LDSYGVQKPDTVSVNYNITDTIFLSKVSCRKPPGDIKGKTSGQGLGDLPKTPALNRRGIYKV